MNRVFLLGVPIDPVSSVQALDHLQSLLLEEGQHHVMTPNSEMLVEAQRNPEFKQVLKASALNLPDSIGLKKMARYTGQHIPERVTGVDTVVELCKVLDERAPVFLLGAKEGVGSRASEKLRESNSYLTIVGTYAGSPSDKDAKAIIKKINEAEPKLLLVAYGAPKQDLWIAKYLQELPSVRVAMGVGGTFDFLAGTQTRAPKMMQSLGLEWLWRLLKEPRRFKRILNAVVVFPILALLDGKK